MREREKDKEGGEEIRNSLTLSRNGAKLKIIEGMNKKIMKNRWR